MLNVYRVAFSNNTSLEITTKQKLSSAIIKSELEKITKCEVSKVSELTNVEVFDIVNNPVDIYFGVDYDFLGMPRKFNRLLIPNIKDELIPDSSDDLLRSKMKNLVNVLYGVDTKTTGLRRY